MRIAGRIRKMESDRRARPCRRCRERGGRIWVFGPDEVIPENFSTCRGCGRKPAVKVWIMENPELSEWRKDQPCV
jgi:hypothetical protein